MSVIRGEMELQVPDDFVETLEGRVASSTFLEPSLRYRVESEPAQLAEPSTYRAPAPRRSFHALFASDSAAAATQIRLEILPGRVRYELHHKSIPLGTSIVFVVVQSILLVVGLHRRELGWLVLAAVAWLASIYMLVKRMAVRRTLERQLRRFLETTK